MSVDNPVGGLLTFKATSDQSDGELTRFFAGVMPAAVGFEEFFARYARLPAEERGTEAFARLATETKAFDVLGPPLAQSEPR